jgi:hypothetical protein
MGWAHTPIVGIRQGLGAWFGRRDQERAAWSVGRFCACSALSDAQLTAIAASRLTSLGPTLDAYREDSNYGAPSCFYYPRGSTRVLLWPVRLALTLGWMPEQHRRPSTPDALAASLMRFPLPRETRTVGDLVDPVCRDDGGPVLDGGTVVRIGEAYGYSAPGDNGFDACDQDVEIVDGPWQGMLTNLRLRALADGSPGPCLLARLALVAPDEPMLEDPEGALGLLVETRAAGRGGPR